MNTCRFLDKLIADNRRIHDEMVQAAADAYTERTLAAIERYWAERRKA